MKRFDLSSVKDPLKKGAVLFSSACVFLAGCIDEGSFSDASPAKTVAVISHAGGPRAPHNSLSSIANSIRLGVDAIEIDLQLSKDGEIVLFHDDRMDEATNTTGKVREKTVDDLRKYNLRNQDHTLSAERIPLLSEVFDLVDRRIPLILEVKDYTNERLNERVVEMIRERDLYADVTVVSFSYNCIRRIHALDSLIVCHYLLNDKKELETLCTDGNFVSTIFLAYQSLDTDMVGMIHKSRKKVYIYTLNSPGAISRKLYSIVDGIITDDPEMWLGVREQ